MVSLDQDKLTLLAGVLKPYLDAQKEREVGVPRRLLLYYCNGSRTRGITIAQSGSCRCA